VADLGCGGGWSSIAIALAYPGVTVDGFDVDAPSIDMARRHAAEAGVDDRVRFHHADGTALPDGDDDAGDYAAVFAFECVHDLADPVSFLATMGRLAGDDGAVIVMDERTEERFTAPGSELERLFYGYSLTFCLPDGLSRRPSVGTGTVMRPDTLAAYAKEAGFSATEVLPVEHDFFRFYRLSPPGAR
jgi:2-polyprenyl-3-methyl-5-hydroxy-6-metoxy-1,4-benzoquinol methylase